MIMKKVFLFMAIALMAVCMTACKSGGKNDPVNPNYFLYAGLVINPEIEPYLSEVAVRYYLPGEDEKVEKLTFHALTEKDTRAYQTFSGLYGYQAEECKVAVFKKTFAKAGPADITFDVKADTTKTVVDKMNILMIPDMEVKASAAEKTEHTVLFSSGVAEDAFYRILLNKIKQVNNLWHKL